MVYPRILSVQDISCVGQCSLTVALPVLSACGVETCVLPTALLSTHTGGLGAPHVRDLTGDMPALTDHWERAGIRFDAVCTGYLGSVEQIAHVEALLDRLAAPGCITVIDPAMADHGKLYAGFDDRFAAAMVPFCGKADYLLPNLTEACLLTGTPYREEYDRAWVDGLVEKLMELGCRNVVLTGVSFERGTTGVMVNHTYLAHPRLEGSCHGTGDIFAAAFSGALLRGKDPCRAGRIAAEYTMACVKLTLAENTRSYGVMFEPLLGSLVAMLEDGAPCGTEETVV